MRVASFVVCFLATAVAVPFCLIISMDAAGIRRPGVNLDAVQLTQPRLAVIAEEQSAFRVAFLGDSVAMSRPRSRSVPAQLRGAVDELGGEGAAVRVISLASPGLGPFDFYFLAAEISRARPDLVVLAVNPAALSVNWARFTGRPELAGWIGLARIPEALGMPLEWVGLTADRVLLYSGIVGLGLDSLWREALVEQARVGRAREALDAALEGASIEEDGDTAAERLRQARIVDAEERGRVAGAVQKAQRGRYGTALSGVDSDHPVVQVLAATLSHLERAGIPAVVYVIPVDVGFFRKIGIYDEAGAARTASALERVVRQTGGRFADLHDLLPSEAFRDRQGHYSLTSRVDGPALVARALAPLVVEGLGRSD